MPINNDSLNKSLYNLLKTQGFNPQPKDSTGKATPVPDEADVFKFTFKDTSELAEEHKENEPAWVTVENGTIKVYYDDDLMDSSGKFTNFLKQLKRWGQRRQLGFELENEDHLASDMAQREHMKQKENISEGYHPMGSRASYNDSVPTVKIVLQHSRQIQEGEQRFRNVARIYLENVQGERILAPTVRPGIAQVYARHLAEGGVPNDERWNHIKSLCEEYTKMAGFVRAVRNNQFNESAQRLVEAGLNHYTNLRESLGKMRGHRGYNAYFESWTPTLMETEGDETNLNELFVQETLDPRIESVMPILNKLSKNLGEMKEVKELEEWADSLTEAPGAETLAHNEKEEEKRMRAFDLDETLDPRELARMKIQKPAFQRTRPDQKLSIDDLRTAGQMPPPAPEDPAKGLKISGKEGMAALNKRLQDIGQVEEEAVEESGLQAYLGNKKYGKEGMDALRKAGREHASKEKMAQIRAKYDKLDEEELAEGILDKIKGAIGLGPQKGSERWVRMEIPAIEKPNQVKDKLIGLGLKSVEHDTSSSGPTNTFYAKTDISDNAYIRNEIRKLYSNSNPQKIFVGNSNGPSSQPTAQPASTAPATNTAPADQPATGSDLRVDRGRLPSGGQGTSSRPSSTGGRLAMPGDPKGVYAGDDRSSFRGDGSFRYESAEQDVEEGLDANQKRVGQLGPTEKVGPKGAVGKLVGASESVESTDEAIQEGQDDLETLLRLIK